jgi:phytanoyl-CoA hydroxylase
MNHQEQTLRFLSPSELVQFNRDGYLVVRKLLASEMADEMKRVAGEHVRVQLAPIEYEVDVKYPGAPADAKAFGGDTTRRLLHAYARHEAYRAWGTNSGIADILRDLFSGHEVVLSQCHHNCVMTKHPGFSSATLWHQDNRYWSFDEQSLISVWTALGNENKDNGCLRVIPGSHKLNLEPGCFDASLFLRPDLPENKSLIQQSVRVELEEGDALFFHSKLFHAAGRNLTSEVKYSLVYTYHLAANQPIKETRSARFPGISL